MEKNLLHLERGSEGAGKKDSMPSTPHLGEGNGKGSVRCGSGFRVTSLAPTRETVPVKIGN